MCHAYAMRDRMVRGYGELDVRKVRLTKPRKIGANAPTKGRLAFVAKGNPYNYTWQQKRARYLAAHPFCVHCREKGLFVAATVVDHIIPHKGCEILFWDKTNWQALCVNCHSSIKQREERGRVKPRIGEDGWPI